MFSKLLIANRGEIAVRIIRACREMGIKSVAIYTEADKLGLHVKMADEAYKVSEEPIKGYLDPEKIVATAVECGAEAIHPGYGFLSEQTSLPELCETNGIAFIGPNANIIKQMGDKIAARQAMEAAGVPVTPGSQDNLEDLNAALSLAEEIGYPIMLKATSGGGGRGIRRCDSKEELERNYDRVISEATKAFGAAEVFLEKYIDSPRHIEVQVIGDKHGNVVHLNERDCSIQRRHQKLLELAPSPQVSAELRAELGKRAVDAAKAIGYYNAGTVEFLMDATGNYYFMEMNTRLQVEHPISEMITGLDIVCEQIRVAAGEPLSFTQEQTAPKGYAAEFRINAEDPVNDFIPALGKVFKFVPPHGPGVRLDEGIYQGYQFQPYFDSMCAKLIVWAPTWESLLARSERALREFEVRGIKTTIPYYLQVLQHPDFINHHFDTSFVERNPELAENAIDEDSDDLATVVGAAVAVALGS